MPITHHLRVHRSEDDLEQTDVPHRVVFLEADEQTLVNRYKETRRRHPLAPQGSVVDGIHAEMELLAPVKERADLCLDTSGLSAAEQTAFDAHRAACDARARAHFLGHIESALE